MLTVGELRADVESGAVVTVAAVARAPAEVAEKYGVMLTDPQGRVQKQRVDVMNCPFVKLWVAFSYGLCLDFH